MSKSLGQTKVGGRARGGRPPAHPVADGPEQGSEEAARAHNVAQANSDADADATDAAGVDDLKATVALNEDALAALLAQVRRSPTPSLTGGKNSDGAPAKPAPSLPRSLGRR